MPRDSRDVYSFLYLNPNITQGCDDGQFKFLGAQSYGGNFSLDGQRSNGGIVGEPTDSKPSWKRSPTSTCSRMTSVRSIAGISNIRVTTKRGGAGYHGSAFLQQQEFGAGSVDFAGHHRQTGIRALSWPEHVPQPYFNLTDIGGSFGGPIPKAKKTWFFVSYERNWNHSPVQVRSSSLPHPTFWTGDFSLLPDSSTSSSTAIKPDVPAGVTLTPEEIANNTVGGAGEQFITIPSRLLNPTTQALINLYFPKIGVGAPIDRRGRIPGYHTILPGRSVIDTGTLRVDHEFSDKDRVYVVYTGSGATIANQSVVGAYPGLGLKQQERRNNTISISYNRVFNMNVINEARGGFNREKLYIHSNTTLGGFLSSIGFDQSDIDAYGAVTGAQELATFGHPAVSFSNVFATFATATGILIGRKIKIWLRSATRSLGSSESTASRWALIL